MAVETTWCQEVATERQSVAEEWKPLYERITGIVDFLELENGETIYLDRKKGAVKLDNKAIPFSTRYLGNQGKVFYRIFKDPTDPNNWFLVAKSKADGKTPLFIVKQNKQRVIWTSYVHQEHSNWQFHQSKRGEIFAYTRDGFCYCWNDSDFSVFQIPVPEDYAGRSKTFRPIELTESEDGVVCFYSVVNREQKLKALNDLLVYDQGWKLVKLGARDTGPAYFVDNQTVEFVAPEKMFRVNIVDGAIIDKANTELVFEETGKQLKPYKRIANGAGESFILWRNFFNSPRRYDVDRFKDGSFHRLAQRTADGWQLENCSFDHELYVDHHSFEDSDGNWWILGGGSIYRKSKAGSWKEFDFRFGIDTGPISRIKVKKDGAVWLFEDGYRNQGDTRIFDHALLQKRIPVSDRWKQVYVKRNSLNTDLGPFKAVDVTGDILIWDQDQLNKIKVPPETQFSGGFEITQDSLKTFWVLGKSSKKNRVAWWQDDKWRVFEGGPDPNGGPDLTAFQVALQTRVELGIPEGYSLGRSATPLAVFGPDKQIAFGTKPAKRVLYFDGNRWHAPIGKQELPEVINYYCGKPFFHDGKLTVRSFHPKGFHQIESKAWAESSNWKARPWRSVELPEGRYPYLDLKKWLAHDATSCPIPEQEQLSVRRTYNNQIKYVSSETHKAVPYREGVWFMLSSDDHQNYQLNNRNAVVDPFGRWFVSAPIKWIDKYYVYEPPLFTVTQQEDDLGKLERPDQATTIPWKPESDEQSDNQYLRMRFRIDQGIWSTWSSAANELRIPAVAEPGKHQLQVEIMNPEMMRASTGWLSYQFETKYDLRPAIEELIAQLSSESFAEREAATEKLVGFGPAALDLLEEATGSLDLERKIRASSAATSIREKWEIRN